MHAGDDSPSWTLVSPYLKLYGAGAVSHSTLVNPEFRHFFIPGVGSLVYFEVRDNCRSIVTVTADPLCAEQHWPLITRRFLETYPKALFWHVTAKYAKVLEGLGYLINALGAETQINVQKFQYGAKTRTIRASARNAKGAGISIRELQPEDLTADMRTQLQHITGDWRDGMWRLFVMHVIHAVGAHAALCRPPPCYVVCAVHAVCTCNIYSVAPYCCLIISNHWHKQVCQYNFCLFDVHLQMCF